jgi:hypothetical protein
MTSPRWAGCLTAASVLCLAGCNGGPQQVDATGGAYKEVASSTELIAQARPPIPDLPVPIGFHLDENRSRNLSAAGFRWVDHVYKGGADKFSVARFYRRQMPINRWVLMTDQFMQGDIILEFDKGTQRCRVIASDGSWLHRCRVKVQLFPKGRVQGPNTTGAKGTTNR